MHFVENALTHADARSYVYTPIIVVDIDDGAFGTGFKILLGTLQILIAGKALGIYHALGIGIDEYCAFHQRIVGTSGARLAYTPSKDLSLSYTQYLDIPIVVGAEYIRFENEDLGIVVIVAFKKQ